MISYLIIIALIAVLIYVLLSEDKLPKTTYTRDAVKITGYIAMDDDQQVFLYSEKPKKYDDQWLGTLHNSILREIDFEKFNINSNTKPIKVEVTLKIISDGNERNSGSNSEGVSPGVD